MARFEYRLTDAANEFPILYYYDVMEEDEIALRFTCDRLVKESQLYEKTSSAIEEDTYIVYVQPKRETRSLPSDAIQLTGGVVVELREHADFAIEFPLIHSFRFPDKMEALLHLSCDYVYVGSHEWLKSGSEVNEDRKCYIIYARKT